MKTRDLCEPEQKQRTKQLSLLLTIMKLTFSLIILLTMTAFTVAYSQKITIKAHEEPLVNVLKELRRQSGLAYVANAQAINKATPVTINLNSTSLQDALKKIFDGQPLRYKVQDQLLFIEARPVAASTPSTETATGTPGNLRPNKEDQQPITGRVLDGDGRALSGATVKYQGGKKVAITDAQGGFVLIDVPLGAEISVHYLGYDTQHLRVSQQHIRVTLTASSSVLDETQVIAYGKTSKRLNTGNVFTVSGEEISRSPVMNPMAALEGRVPGMIVSQSSGVPGSTVNLQIRGRTQVDPDLGAGESPLIIIDGIPLASGNEDLNNLLSAISGTGTHGLSPFATINPGDIESIDVLKDADATAIYGSRGASGVIIITTKRGKTDGLSIHVRAVTGFSKAQKPDLLTTPEYLMMRREAFANDGIEMTSSNAYDLLLWDTTRVGLVDQLIGGRSAYSNIEGSISGGNELTRFNLGGSYFKESDVFPNITDLAPNKRTNGFINVSTTSANKRFIADFRGNYSFTHNQAPGADLSQYLTLPPHIKLFEADGSLAWNEGGRKTDNPLAQLLRTYSAKTTNLIASALLGYKFMENLELKASVGYNRILTDELRNTPLTAQNPMDSRSAMSQFGKTEYHSLIFEPQLHYQKSTTFGTFTGLLGGTWQAQRSDRMNFTIKDYPSDDFLGTLIGIPSSGFSNPSSSDNEYKYTAAFGRLSYNLHNKYLINLSGRRDGSSRFGPNFRFSNFGAIGGAWIFSNENFFTRFAELMSFGKLRASYGVTGNDKIGDYKYRDLYGSDPWGPTYDQQLALSPTSLFKPDLHWERNKKLEVAVELGFLKDRIIFGAAWYRNRSSDPLVQYALPYSTGFSSVTANLTGVVVQNKGLELTVNSKNIASSNFEWRTSFNLTLPSNKLIAYPGLENSTYAKKYVIGRPLDLVFASHFLGVDPTTGLYSVEDLNGSGKYEIVNINGDLRSGFDSEPAFYGGLQNDFRYKDFALSFFFNFTKQWMQNWRSLAGTSPVGGIRNMPRYVLNRWREVGDETDVQRFTTISSASNSLVGNYASSSSDAKWENIFFARLRTVELRYSLPGKWMNKVGVRQLNVMLQGQNLFTYSPFRGSDPQTIYTQKLAPLRTYVVGLQMNL